jgi:hypothetical protein
MDLRDFYSTVTWFKSKVGGFSDFDQVTNGTKRGIRRIRKLVWCEINVMVECYEGSLHCLEMSWKKDPNGFGGRVLCVKESTASDPLDCETRDIELALVFFLEKKKIIRGLSTEIWKKVGKS